MNWVRRICTTVRSGPLNEDISAEVQFHIERRTQELIDDGVAPHMARAEVLRRFGNPTTVVERTREGHILEWLESFLQDLHYALRGFARSPLFTAAAVFSIGLGIGANSAIFGIIDSLAFRLLPARAPQELVQLMVRPKKGAASDSFSYPIVIALAERDDIFRSLGGFGSSVVNVGGSESAEPLLATWVSGDYFQTLGLTPLAGRLIGREDDRQSAAPAAVIAEPFWRRNFGSDPRLVGKSILVDGYPVTVVGVAPRGFEGTEIGRASAIMLPVVAMRLIYPELSGRLAPGAEWLHVLARPRVGISFEQVNARLAVTWPQIVPSAIGPRMSPARKAAILNSTIELTPGGTGFSSIRKDLTQPLWILMALVAVVLLVACANVANLLIARAETRQREFAIRSAIGASRSRLIRQMLTESFLLSGLAAALALLIAHFVSPLILACFSHFHGVPISLDLSVSWHTLTFTSLAALGTSFLFGLAPAVVASGLKRRLNKRLMSSLVVAQVAFTVVLLIGAGLFVRTIQNLHNVKTGFRDEGVLLARIDLHRGMSKALIADYREQLEQLNRRSQIVAASVSATPPLGSAVWTEGIAINNHKQAGDAHFSSVSPRYFETMRIPLLAGRDFSPHEDAPVAIVNDAFVKEYLAGMNPIESHVASRSFANLNIVGVVADSISEDVRKAPVPLVYVPFFDSPIEFPTFVVRVSGSIADATVMLRSSFQTMAQGRTIRIETLTSRLEAATSREEVLALMAIAFGSVALVLATIGIYGVLAFAVSRRATELSIRMALGAMQNTIIWLILRDALRLIATGIVLGVGISFALSHAISSILFGLSPNDASTLFVASFVVVTVGCLAAWIPAYRASCVDAINAVRCD